MYRNQDNGTEHYPSGIEDSPRQAGAALLLELEITDEMNLATPVNGEDKVVLILPAKTDIYTPALDAIP